MKYKISIPDSSNIKIWGFEADFYEAGETVKFSLPNISDTRFYVSSEQVQILPDPDIVRGYFFVMPECDVIVNIKSKSTMVAHGVVDGPFMGFVPSMGMMNNPQAPANPAITSGPRKFCPECGYANQETAKFCVECGGKFV